MKILIGHTGFVGSNLYKQGGFDAGFNSKNIEDAYGTKPNLCLYSGIRPEKFRADRFPEDDLLHVQEALEHIKRIQPQKLVLISTVDVIPQGQTQDIYEDTSYQTEKLTPYGKNRLFLEQEVRALYPETLIIRLPALFGAGLKKNFISDLITRIPAMLKRAKMEELSAKEAALLQYYSEDENGFFRLKPDISEEEARLLRNMFENLGFSAVHFTDSRSNFAFYNLNYLWAHIETLMAHKIKLAHMAAEPIRASVIYESIYGKAFINEILDTPFDYSFFKTSHSALLGGGGGYIFSRDVIGGEINDFVKDAVGGEV